MMHTKMKTDVSNYDCYCKFDLEKHKNKYTNYLEVMILSDGTVDYAVPSHQMYAENAYCKQRNISYQQMIEETAKDHMYDYLEYLLTETKLIAVWNEAILCGNCPPTAKQLATLKKLKMNGLYRGAIPQFAPKFPV